MANIAIDTGGKTLNVDIDGWENMNPSQQASAVDAVSQHISGSNTFGGDLQGGAHDTMTGLSQTANALGGVAARNDYPQVGSALSTAGQFLSDHAPAAVAPSPANDVGSALSQGRYSDLPSALAHSAVRALPSVAPILAGAAIPGVGPAVAGLAAGAESLGPTAYQRAANNGRDVPDTVDVEGAIPSTAVQAGLGAILPGGSAGRIASLPLRAGAKVGIEAATGAGMNLAGQLGGSVGTDAGTQVDPYELAAAGLTQGVIGAGRQIAPLAGAGVRASTDNVMSRLGNQPASIDDAASMSRVGDAYDAQLQAVQGTRGGDTNPTSVLNSLKAETFQRTKAYGQSLLDAGILPDSLKSSLSAVLDQAQRHNNEIVSGGLDTSSLFDDIKNSQVNPDVLQPLLNGIRDLNTLSTQSFMKNQTGPFRQLGNNVAQLASVGLPLSHGNLIGAGLAMAGHGQVGKIGGIAGGALDNVLGTATPPILLQRLAAQRYLNRSGADAGPATLPSLTDATDALRGLQAQPQDIPATVSAPAASDPIQHAITRAKAWQKVQGRPFTPPDIQDAWQQSEAPAQAAVARNQVYQAGANLTGQFGDPLANVPTETPGMLIDPKAQADLDTSQANFATSTARQQQGINDLLNRIQNRKANGQTIDSLAQAKIDKAVKANSVDLAAADKLPTDDAHSASIAGQAAMVSALDQAKAVMNRGNSATPALADRMAVGLPAGDLMGYGAEPQTYKAAPPPPPPLPLPLQTPVKPAYVPTPQSGPAPELSLSTPATQGRPWEQFVGKTLPPTVTRQQVYDALDAVHTPDMAASLKAEMSGANRELLQPVIEHLRAQEAAPPASWTREIAMPRQWEAGKADYREAVARQAAEARAAGLPDTAEALEAVGIYTKGQAAKAEVRDAHLATIIDAAKRSQAAALFTKRLMQHGPK